LLVVADQAPRDGAGMQQRDQRSVALGPRGRIG